MTALNPIKVLVSCSSALILLAGSAWGQPAADTPPGTDEAQITPLAQPPLRVLGTAILAEKRIAVIELLDEQGRETGVLSVPEGETVHGYRVSRVEVDRVLVDRDGQSLLLAVGHGPTAPAALPKSQEREQGERFRATLQDALQHQLNEDPALRSALIEAIRAHVNNQKGERQ